MRLFYLETNQGVRVRLGSWASDQFEVLTPFEWIECRKWAARFSILLVNMED